MGERFVVVPVDIGGGVAGDREHSDAVVADPAPDTGGGSCSSSSAAGGSRTADAAEDSVFEPDDPNTAVPILEYNREPNKYGETAVRPYPYPYPLSVKGLGGRV